MKPKMELDFVSDVACPWCAVGLFALSQALERLGGEFDIVLRFQPFELNPVMGREGQDATEYLSAKYGSTPQEQAANRERIRARGAEVGFDFKPEGRGRIWNTFDAHRLLHWAGEVRPDKQLALKKALLTAYHGRAENVSAPDVLTGACEQVGLDGARARAILGGDEFGLAVREHEQQWQQAGIHSVPALVVNRQHLISGGQPAAAYEQALRRMAADA